MKRRDSKFVLSKQICSSKLSNNSDDTTSHEDDGNDGDDDDDDHHHNIDLLAVAETLSNQGRIQKVTLLCCRLPNLHFPVLFCLASQSFLWRFQSIFLLAAVCLLVCVCVCVCVCV